MDMIRQVGFRRLGIASTFLATVLAVGWIFLSQGQAQPMPEPKAEKAASTARHQKLLDEELEKIRAIFPKDQAVTIFSKDFGPIENVRIVKMIEFLGVKYFHLEEENGWTHLVRCEGITHIRRIPPNAAGK